MVVSTRLPHRLAAHDDLGAARMRLLQLARRLRLVAVAIMRKRQRRLMRLNTDISEYRHLDCLRKSLEYYLARYTS